MKLLICLVLLTTSQFTHASKVTKSEITCIAKSVYHEGRSLTKKHWLKIANVAYNRKLNFATAKHGAVSSHLCDIVKSHEYHTRGKLNLKMQEPEVFSKILYTLQSENWYNVTKAVYFSTIHNKVNYKLTWEN
jgi:hypothetical protein